MRCFVYFAFVSTQIVFSPPKLLLFTDGGSNFIILALIVFQKFYFYFIEFQNSVIFLSKKKAY
ncbi:MAG: hypothetical protein D8M18_07635 [Bacteroidetes bacterium]|nr:hypothetical protein [Bacteroidota bacterium]